VCRIVRLAPDEHFVLTATRDLWLTASGRAAVAALLRDRGDVWRSTLWREELIQNGFPRERVEILPPVVRMPLRAMAPRHRSEAP